jgi:hypothetical protein
VRVCRRSISRSRSRSPSPLPTKLFVKHLTRNITSAHLKEIFENYGSVVSAEVVLDRRLDIPKGFGYVIFNKNDDAEQARIHLNGVWPMGFSIGEGEWLVLTHVFARALCVSISLLVLISGVCLCDVIGPNRWTRDFGRVCSQYQEAQMYEIASAKP